MRRLSLNSIALRRFRSFAEADLAFPSHPGVTFIVGPNGAGKSSLADGLNYAFFGTSIEGLESPTLCQLQGPKSFAATVRLTDTDRGPVVVTRDWNGGRLSLTPGDAEKIVGLVREQFVASVLFGQGRPLFIDLTPSARLEVFSDLLRLGVYDEASDRAKVFRKAVEIRTQALDKVSARADGLLVNTQEDSLQEELRTLRSDAAGIREALAIAKGALDTFHSTTIDEKQRNTVRLAAILAELTPAREAEQVVRSAEREVARLEVEHRSAQIELQRWKDACGQVQSEGVCESCGQKLPKKLLDQRLQDLKVKESSALRWVGKLEAELGEYRGALEEAKHQVPSTDNLRIEEKKIVEWTAKVRHQEGVLSANVTLAEQRLNSNAVAYSRAEGRLQQIHDRKVAVQTAKREVDQALVALRQDGDTLKLVQTDFKSMRLMVVEEVLEYLNAESNALLSRFGMPDYQIKFFVKEHGTRQSLECTVALGSTTLPFVAYSGGERQRLRIVSAFGQANVVQRLAGVEYKFEWWDEPSSWLSQDGVMVLLQMLQERAMQGAKRIILTDHRALDFAGFDQVVEIGKEDGQSRIVSNRIFSGE